MSLSADQLEFYRKNGYLAVEEVVSETRVKAMRDRIEQLCADWQSDQARRVGAQQEAGHRRRLDARPKRRLGAQVFRPVAP